MIATAATDITASGEVIYGEANGSATRPSTFIVQNQSDTVSVWLGGGQYETDGTLTVFVTPANGVELAPGASMSLDLTASELLVGITSAGTAEVRTLRNAA